eukprot:m.311594 g.311594  ORF g.311594 m.311594 type:complete len:382 (+) comp85090_c0_seq1:36-1181(+)
MLDGFTPLLSPVMSSTAKTSTSESPLQPEEAASSLVITLEDDPTAQENISSKEANLAQIIAGEEITAQEKPSKALKTFVVIGFTLCLVAVPFLVAMTKKDGKFLYHSYSAVFQVELGKMALSAVTVIILRPSIKNVNIRSAIITAVPALIYMISNNFHYFMLLYSNPASINIIANVRLPMVAAVYRIILGRKISLIRFVAMGGLLVGVIVSQIKFNMSFSVSPFGLLLILIKCSLSVVGGVYSELVFKHHKSDFYLLNLQMYAWGLLLNAAAFIYKSEKSLDKVMETFFDGFTLLVWISIWAGVLAGLLTGAIVKHLDNISKTFCTSVASILLGILTFHFHVGDFQLTPMFFMGGAIIAVSSYIYSVDKIPESWKYIATLI